MKPEDASDYTKKAATFEQRRERRWLCSQLRKRHPVPEHKTSITCACGAVPYTRGADRRLPRPYAGVCIHARTACGKNLTCHIGHSLELNMTLRGPPKDSRCGLSGHFLIIS